jgi:tripartite-type tricarboxylate transporter receptor subunit TctC
MRDAPIPDSHSAGEKCRKTAPTRRAAAGVVFGAGVGSIAPWARLAAMAALVPTPGAAQVAYPVRPVRIVVPFAPGGGADLIARILTPHLQQRLEQSFFVDNRAGAAGRIGAAAVAKADPDGHTLLMTTESSIVIAPHIGVAMVYDPIKDFAPVSLLTRNPVVLVVHPSVPAATLADYISLARAKPGQMFYASSGAGGPNHLAGEIFKQMTASTSSTCPIPAPARRSPAVISNQVGAMWGFSAPDAFGRVIRDDDAKYAKLSGLFATATTAK